jgi:diguanylate cyclase (GGDEF)-like protein
MNRRSLLQIIEAEVKRLDRYPGFLSLLVIEVDELKALIERHGRSQADRIFSLLSQLIARNVREVDTLGRYGGNRFLVVLPETEDRAARLMAEKQKAQTAATVFWLDHDVEVRLALRTVVVRVDNSALDASALLANVDEALDRARLSDSVGTSEE